MSFTQYLIVLFETPSLSASSLSERPSAARNCAASSLIALVCLMSVAHDNALAVCSSYDGRTC